jgi:hypothetical protein
MWVARPDFSAQRRRACRAPRRRSALAGS